MSHKPKHAAPRFALALRKAMSAKGMTSRELAATVGVQPCTIWAWRSGSVPHRDRLGPLAEALDAPRLVALAIEGRTKVCNYCGQEFVAKIKAWRMLYCSTRHKSLAQSKVDREERLARRPETMDDLKGRIAELETSLEYAVKDATEGQAAIDAMCWDCEWDGVCKTPACKLRGRSPLPLAKAHAA